jgi:hypothetical protein
MSPTDYLVHAYTTGGKLVHMMVDDLTPDEFERQPVPGANCAAWVIGHLTLSLRGPLVRQRVRGLPDFPADLKDKVTTTKQVAGDQAGYGDPNALLALFDAHLDHYVRWVRGLTPEVMDAVQENRVPFSTTFGEGVQYGAMHIAMHVGQLSTIRRALGRPPLV